MEILKHYVPHVYNQVLKDMPPMEHWERFTFGSSVLGRQMARVSHPVQGIEVGQDGNGSLVPENGAAVINRTDPRNNRRCSVCDPSHLAQNKFSSLLLDEARRMELLTNQQRAESHLDYAVNIFHGESVQCVEEHDSKLIVQTDQRQIEAQYVIAAEGCNSQTRIQHGGELAGNTAMQHLINVHFRTSQSLSKRLMERNDAIGMLHFVFNKDIVGAFVCHNLEEGEWVLQIPYFPPFQEPKDYTLERVREMVRVGLVGHNSSTDNTIVNDIDILTIKPWTMAATVANSFLIGDSKRIILAGDAAHAFPPAGGFGMNTGLQDAHNLAWRLAMSLQNGGVSKEIDAQLLRPYESERRPIASQNAALSVRNFNRTLDIAKACYLNADHPTLLKRVLETPPISFLPLAVRQQTFTTAVKTAMLPLTKLGSIGNIYGDSIAKNVRKILESGGGLPLLFPRFEIGFSYDPLEILDDGDDTAGYYPKVAVGYRLPHVPIEIIESEYKDGDEAVAAKFTTMTDIEAQIQERWKCPLSPRHTVILWNPINSGSMRNKMLEWAQSQNDVELKSIELYSKRLEARDRHDEIIKKGIESNVLLDERSLFAGLVSEERMENKDDTIFYAVLVRPDGHIAAIKSFLYKVN
jgi:2-polyprenyl-6-methoxyphenol hydroxylase-like FAD-dependent oxidoreductase